MFSRAVILSSCCALAAACTHSAPPVPVPVDRIYYGPDTAMVDLLRTEEGGNRIFAQATLPDGEKGLFLIDTGAAISALSTKTAERLELPIQHRWGTLEGLGGTTPFNRAVLPMLALGEAIVPDVEIAVDVRGLPDEAGAMPLDGIIGNNVLSRFVVEIDYPADLMVLHRPDTVRIPRHARQMLFEGGHVLTALEVTTDSDPPETGLVFTQIDTGASGLVLSGSSGSGFEDHATEGVEPVYGIGASETLPPSVFLQRTRRIPLSRVELGGRAVDVHMDARWLNFEGGIRIGPEGMRGLAGHDLMAGHVAIFDYDGQAFAMKKSRRKKRSTNGHAVLLDQDLARYGDDPARYLYRARLHIWMGEPEVAVDQLRAYLEHHPNDAEARVLLTGMLRVQGDLDGSWEVLSTLSPADLVDEGEIVAAVNGLLLDQRADEARELAAKAIEYQPDTPRGDDDLSDLKRKLGWSHVARADVLLATGELEAANLELLEAARLVENPDAHLLRRARVALARGDDYGAMAHVRRLLQLYPSAGQFLWYYSLLVDAEADQETFRLDMDEAISRLHPGHYPLDFMVAANQAIGNEEPALELMQEGIERDCEPIQFQPSRDNCYAWYTALAHHHTDEALRRIDRALAAEGDRSDFLDTKAVVHLSRGEYEEAHRSAVAAARLSPDDIYMLWQAERIGELARQSTEVP